MAKIEPIAPVQGEDDDFNQFRMEAVGLQLANLHVGLQGLSGYYGMVAKAGDGVLIWIPDVDPDAIVEEKFLPGYAGKKG